ncbi:MAG: hypothetical protein IH987_06290 [Planctomycetes bacterium]|nr:hypothetical protein [Planctomycetota bacterium]
MTALSTSTDETYLALGHRERARVLVEHEEEDGVVREEDDLAVLRLFTESQCDTLSIVVVKGRNGVIQHEGRTIFGDVRVANEDKTPLIPI